MRIHPRFFYFSIHVIFWIVMFVILCPKPIGVGVYSLDFLAEEENLWFFLYGFSLNLILIYSYSHLGLPWYLTSNKISIFLLLNAAFIFVFTGVESIIDYLYVGYSRYNNLISSNLVVTSIVVVVANFYGYTHAWFRDQRNRNALEQAKLQAELSALKHQINPHFLFNILNGLYGLAFKNDDEPTADGIAKLSHLMRYMLYESNETYVPLKKEIEYIENYIALQEIRVNEATQIHFFVSGHIQDKQVAPMLFIPFIENAFKYGISTVQASRIDISLIVGKEALTFGVSNPIHVANHPNRDVYGGIGLKNVRKRLNLIYKDTYQLQIQDTGVQYDVQLTIPL